jgi:hypothetical protein
MPNLSTTRQPSVHHPAHSALPRHARCPPFLTRRAQGGDYKYPDYARAAPRAAAAQFTLALDAMSAAAPRRLRIPLPPGF